MTFVFTLPPTRGGQPRDDGLVVAAAGNLKSALRREREYDDYDEARNYVGQCQREPRAIEARSKKTNHPPCSCDNCTHCQFSILDYKCADEDMLSDSLEAFIVM